MEDKDISPGRIIREISNSGDWKNYAELYNQALDARRLVSSSGLSGYVGDGSKVGNLWGMLNDVDEALFKKGILTFGEGYVLLKAQEAESEEERHFVDHVTGEMYERDVTNWVVREIGNPFLQELDRSGKIRTVFPTMHFAKEEDAYSLADALGWKQGNYEVIQQAGADLDLAA